MISIMKKMVTFLLALSLLALGCAVSSAESIARMHYVFQDWVGEYTGQVDSNKIPFGYGLFVSATPKDGELWHYIGTWENGLPEGEGAVYFENGNMLKGFFSGGELIEGLSYSVTGLSAVQVKMDRSMPEADDVQYIGNKKSQKFHYPTCRSVSQMSEKNKIEFHSREEAVERGYRPCGECNP